MLAFGAGNLPDDEDEAAALVSAAIDRGVNYFETGPGYAKGTSERKIGLGVKDRRNSVLVSTKSMAEGDADADTIRAKVEESLKVLQTDYVDFYQFWGMGWKWWDHLSKRGGALAGLRKLQHEGVIRHIGFTSHDSAENVIKLMATGEFVSATLQYNILSAEQADAIAFAHENDIGVIAMCPAAGGLLVDPAKRLRAALPDSTEIPASVSLATSAEFALRFVWSCEGITSAASGLTSLAVLEENVAIAERFEALDESERSRVDAILNEFAIIGDRFCTGCRYCMPCPNGVWIPAILRLLNYTRLLDLRKVSTWQYNQWPERVQAAACIECGECESKCPHGIPIIAQLKEAAELFGDTGPVKEG
jgi:predicted aldo/keto reductase-like oxidoreductase